MTRERALPPPGRSETSGARAPLVRRRPRPVLRLPQATPVPLLALGGRGTATVALTAGREVFVALPPRGRARPTRLFSAQDLERALGQQAGAIAVDHDPGLASSRLGRWLADERGARLIALPHQLAHAAAVLAEHGRLPSPRAQVAALVLDGPDLGMDGTTWGAEWLTLDGTLDWRRRAHASALPLVGGRLALREPWRVACAALARIQDIELLPRSPLARHVPVQRLIDVARRSLEAGAWPLCSAAGSFFEAAGALFGLASRNGYAGEAAIRLEELAMGEPDEVECWSEVQLDPERDELPSARVLAAALRRLLRDEPPARVAAALHATWCRLAAELALRVLPPGVRCVALAGACLVNGRLARELPLALARRGFEPLSPVRLPAGDAALACGQAALAALALARGNEPRYRPES